MSLQHARIFCEIKEKEKSLRLTHTFIVKLLRCSDMIKMLFNELS